MTVTGPQGSRNAKSDALGRYAIDNLVPGFYDVTAEAPGFKKVESKHNEMVVNVSSTLKLEARGRQHGGIGGSKRVRYPD